MSAGFPRYSSQRGSDNYMPASRLLPERLRGKILEMPEYSYGVTRVIVILDDGSQVSDVYVSWDLQVVKVGGSQQLTFDPARVVDVRVQEEFT